MTKYILLIHALLVIVHLLGTNGEDDASRTHSPYFEVKCKCSDNHPDHGCVNGSDYCTPGSAGKCFHLVEKIKERLLETWGCFSKKKLGNFPMYCRPTQNPNMEMDCCDQYDYCNDKTVTLPPPTEKPTELASTAKIIIICAGILCFIFAVVGICFLVRFLKKRKEMARFKNPESGTLTLSEMDIGSDISIKGAL